MSFAFTTSTREVLEQVVRDPRFRLLTTIPVIALPEIGLMALAFLLFTLGSLGFLAGVLPWPVMVIINSFAVYVSFTPLHDATHRTLSGNRVVNDLLGTVSCLLLLPGVTTSLYRYLHLEHHRHTGALGKDPDEVLVSASGWRLPLVLAGTDIVWIWWYLRRWSERPAAERRAFAASIGTYLLFHVVWLASPYWREFILVWVIPQRLGLTSVAYFFAHIQHPEHVLWETAPFQTTVRLTVTGWVHRLLLGQAEHCMHHFAPSLPYYRYQAGWEIGRHLFEAQNIPTRTLFRASRDLVLPDQAAVAGTWLAARVVAVTQVAADVCAYDFVPADGLGWPAFEAGAHIDVEIAPGLVRQYSLCNAPGVRDHYRIAVKRDADGRGGSRRLHDQTRAGDTLRISAPRNHFPLDRGATRHVLVAGGIGVTPLLAMAHALAKKNAIFSLHVFAGSSERIPFRETIEDAFGERVKLHFGRAAMADSTEIYRPGSALYVCGPAGFMDAVIAEARAQGWPNDAIFSESFKPRPGVRRENVAFEVELKRSGRVLTVPADQSLLEVLHAHGCPVTCTCTQGICGSCLTPVLAGEPEHRDAILSDAERAENRLMTVCVSRAISSRLVLDI